LSTHRGSEFMPGEDSVLVSDKIKRQRMKNNHYASKDFS
jgi:hypothetical protein